MRRGGGEIEDLHIRREGAIRRNNPSTDPIPIFPLRTGGGEKGGREGGNSRSVRGNSKEGMRD
jgi:hypothetical protein